MVRWVWYFSYRPPKSLRGKTGQDQSIILIKNRFDQHKLRSLPRHSRVGHQDNLQSLRGDNSPCNWNQRKQRDYSEALNRKYRDKDGDEGGHKNDALGLKKYHSKGWRKDERKRCRNLGFEEGYQ